MHKPNPDAFVTSLAELREVIPLPPKMVQLKVLQALGEMIVDQTNPGGRLNRLGARIVDRVIARDAKENLY